MENFKKKFLSKEINDFKKVLKRIDEITNFEKFCHVCLKATKNRKKIFTAYLLCNIVGKLRKFSKYPVTIPSNNRFIIRVVELLIGKVLYDYLEQNV